MYNKYVHKLSNWVPSKLQIICMSIVAILAGIICIYYTFVLAKDASYSIFYEDMVKETVREMLQSNSLPK